MLYNRFKLSNVEQTEEKESGGNTGTVTIFDVAEASGYSAITVSRVINSPNMVKPKTAAVIKEKIKELNYSPNYVAKALASKCTNIIYLYIPQDLEFSHPFVMQVVASISEELGNNGYSLFVSRKWYTSEHCDGIIVLGLLMGEEERLKKLSTQKQVVVFGHIEGIDNCVDVDNEYGSYLITNHVLQKGYKEIGFIGINERKIFALDRQYGFLKALKENGITPNTKRIVLTDNKKECGFEAAERLLKLEPSVKTLVCASDLLAIGAIDYIKSCGLKVPQDIAVTGFDGLGFENTATPRLTTVRQPIMEVGAYLAHKIVGLLKDKERPESKTILFRPELLAGESC